MSEPILERIALWHAAAIAEITIAGGYHQTLAVTRSEDLLIDGNPQRDKTTVCALGECTEDRQRTGGVYFWRQVFDCFVQVLGSAGTGDSVDTRIARIIADVHTRMGLELKAARTNRGRYCGGLAYRLDLLPWEIGIVLAHNTTIVSIPVAIAFDVLADDPCSNS
jgi:hypothetical protein